MSIDLSPFEPAMPDAVRGILAQARAGEGAATDWMRGRGDAVPLLRGYPAKLPDETVGWLAGIGMFTDDDARMKRVILREHHDAVIPYVVDAFAAGIRGGVPPQKLQWKHVEALCQRLDDVPPSVLSIRGLGATHDQARVRGVALRLAVRLGEPARGVLEQARAAAPSKSHARRLDQAIATLSGEVQAIASPHPHAPEHASLLAQLLEAWRTTHDPALEEELARLGEQLAQARGALVARSKGELEGAWLALAGQGDAADLDRLLDAPWPAAWKSALARVDALARFAPDPRLGRKLARVVLGYTTKGSAPLQYAIASALAASPTPSALPGIGEIEKARGYSTVQIYAAARAAIAAIEPRPADPELLARARGTATRSVDIEALYDEVAKSPGDLGIRAVLADALQAAGDLHGELISLQLAIAAGTAGAQARSRVATLLAAKIDEWTGPLPDLDRASRRFERGFLTAATTTATGAALAASADRREWATVEELTAMDASAEAAPLVRSMPLLRVLVAPDALIDALGAGAPLPSIRVLGVCGRWRALPAFPNLRVLFLHAPPDIAAVQRAAADLGLHAVVYQAGSFPAMEQIARVRRAGPRETRIVAVHSRQGYAPDFVDPEGWRVRLSRDSDHADVSWGGGHAYHLGLLEGVIAALAQAGIDDVSVHVHGVRRAEAEAVAARAVERLGGRVAVRLDGAPIDLAEDGTI
ncbi:MAG: hypothetical protein ACTHU0_11525 [Kofleriaceae bacterium]